MKEPTKSIVTREDIRERLNDHFTAVLPAMIALAVALSLLNICWLAENWLCYGMALFGDVGIVALVIAAIAEGRPLLSGR